MNEINVSEDEWIALVALNKMAQAWKAEGKTFFITPITWRLKSLLRRKDDSIFVRHSQGDRLELWKEDQHEI